MSKDLTKPFLIDVDRFGKPEDGFLNVLEWQKHLPFEVKRVYWFKNDSGTLMERGNHSHINLLQVVSCVAGQFKVRLESPEGETSEYVLNSESSALFIPNSYWRVFDIEEGGILLSLVSEVFDESDYVRNYTSFKGKVE